MTEVKSHLDDDPECGDGAVVLEGGDGEAVGEGGHLQRLGLHQLPLGLGHGLGRELAPGGGLRAEHYLVVRTSHH